MGGETKPTDDPFAGYTPVRSAVPVLDGFVPDLPQEKPRRARRKRSRGTSANGIKILFAGIISVVLISVLAAVTYGFVHKRSAREIAPEFASFLERMRPVSEFGRSLRDKINSSRFFNSPDDENRRSPRRGDTSVTFPAAMTNVVLQKSRVESAQRIADGAPEPDVAQPESRQENRHVVDPSLKKFKTGGRVVRPIRKGN